MKLFAIGATVVIVVALGLLFGCKGHSCIDSNSFRYLNTATTSGEYGDLLTDARFAKVDADSIAGFIDSRHECSSFKRAAESLSLYVNSHDVRRATENRIEAILIYKEARRRHCNVD